MTPPKDLDALVEKLSRPICNWMNPEGDAHYRDVKNALKQCALEWADKTTKDAAYYRALLYGCSDHGLWTGLACIGCLEQDRDQWKARAEKAERELYVIKNEPN